jgi:hypothetical protein
VSSSDIRSVFAWIGEHSICPGTDRISTKVTDERPGGYRLLVSCSGCGQATSAWLTSEAHDELVSAWIEASGSEPPNDPAALRVHVEQHGPAIVSSIRKLVSGHQKRIN